METIHRDTGGVVVAAKHADFDPLCCSICQFRPWNNTHGQSAYRPANQEIFDVMHAMRWLKPHLVPDELVGKILDSAIRAPNGGNEQPWHFVGAKDMETQKKVQFWYNKALDEASGRGDLSEFASLDRLGEKWDALG